MREAYMVRRDPRVGRGKDQESQLDYAPDSFWTVRFLQLPILRGLFEQLSNSMLD